MGIAPISQHKRSCQSLCQIPVSQELFSIVDSKLEIESKKYTFGGTIDSVQRLDSKTGLDLLYKFSPNSLEASWKICGTSGTCAITFLEELQVQ